MVFTNVTGYPIQELHHDKRVYRGEDPNGRLLFRTNLIENHDNGCLTGAQVVALGLTEVCCEIGVGKVFWFPLSTNSTARYSYHQMPNIVYEPLVWGKKDTEQWLETPHSDRLALLNARGGSIMAKQCVMPIALDYDPLEKETLRFNGFNTEDTGCKATLAIVPKAYIGWCTQLQQGARLEIFNRITNSRTPKSEQWWKADISHLEVSCRAQTAKHVAYRLDEMYYSGEPRSLSVFEDILTEAAKLHQGQQIIDLDK